jgi:hypothetical protein
MKKFTALFLSAALLTSNSFAETTVTDTSQLPASDVNGVFDIKSTASGTTSVSVPPVVTEPASVVINNKMELVAKTKQEEDEKLPYTMTYGYPQITGENLSTSAQKFNRLVEERVNASVQQFKNYVKADMPHMQTLPDSLKHNSFQMTYTVDVLKPGKQVLISLRLSIEGMQAGRAHPYHKHQTLNFDLSTGKELTLKDLFKPRVKYLNVLSKYASTELNKKLQDKWMIKEGTAPIAKNYDLWNVKKNGILVTFEEYQVAPYAYGSQDIEIPFSVLKNLIALNSPIAVCVKEPDGC